MNKQSMSDESNQISYSIQTTQEWFASIITNPLGENGIIQSHTSNGLEIAEEAARYIVPSPTLQPHQRIQIYNQQYWWRLLNTLHSNFPLVTRLFGSLNFNDKIGIPYLMHYPSQHWSLYELGKHLPKWIQEFYQEPDKMLVYHAACLDWAFTASFIAPQFPPLDLTQINETNSENWLFCPFYLQPHIHLFIWEYDLLTFRINFLKKEVDYWMHHRFPKLNKHKTYRFVLYRNHKNNISWRAISQSEQLLLEKFQAGSTLTDACEYLENQETTVYEYAAKHLQKWIQEWTQAGWLTLQKVEPPT